LATHYGYTLDYVQSLTETEIEFLIDGLIWTGKVQEKTAVSAEQFIKALKK